MNANDPSFDNTVGPRVRERTPERRGLFAVLFTFVVLAGAQTATQLCARDFGYQPALGPNARRIYPPWGIASWALRWSGRYPRAFASAFHTGLLVHSRMTRAVTESVVFSLVASVAVIALGVFLGRVPGVYVALLGVVLGALAQVGWLVRRSRPILVTASRRPARYA